jgi:hypothetical protein
MKPIIALLYDFDKTLCTTDMQNYAFIPALGMTPTDFWTLANTFGQENHMDALLAYMYTMIAECRRRNIRLDRDFLIRCGRDIQLFPGVTDWFARINDFGQSQGVEIEHYVLSSGLKEIIEGSPIAHEFKHVFAGTFLYDANGEAEWPGISVDYTTKTQFLFKISKGIFSSRDNKQVNESIADDKKRIPFTHMIYFGDGDTDVPCMKIVGMFGGHSIAVYDPQNERKKATAAKLKRQGRVAFAVPAVYTPDAPAFRVVTAIIDKIKADWVLSRLSK